MKLIIFATHPVQYQVPVYRQLAREYDLTVMYMHRQDASGQGKAGFGVDFEWDVPLFDGYRYIFLRNASRRPSTASLFGIRLSGLHTVFRQYKPDKVIVQGWFPYAYLQVIRHCRRHGIELICRGDSNLLMEGGYVRKQLKKMYMRWLLPKFSKFLVVGCNNKAFYEYYSVPQNKLFFAPHSIDTPFFKHQFSGVKKQGSLKIRIGFSGKFISKKRPLDLIRAVNQSDHRDEIELIFIGDGPMKNEMDQLGRYYKLSMTFTGFLNQTEIVPGGYANLDLLVLPSVKNETWGLVINEAMTGGIPTIVSDKVGCGPDFIEDGKTGYVFKNGRADDLAEKIDLFIGKLKSGYDFRSCVLEKINSYSLEMTIKGIRSAL